jgi:hypothetical protein
MKLKDIKFTVYLGIISILGFLTILLQNAINVDINLWVESLLFIIIGFALFVAGGYHLIFAYFKGGLTTAELNRIVTVVTGFSSMVIGVLSSPPIAIEAMAFKGVKVVIAAIAIFVILLEMIVDLKVIK